MWNWLVNHLTTFGSYMIAPIVYHSACDGYVIAFIFTVMELNDTFGEYRIYAGFVLLGLLLRNHLFSIFKLSKTLLSRSYTPTLDSNKNTSVVSNKVKLLGVSVLGLLKTQSASLKNAVKVWLKK
jgi:hypothetical protein